MADWAACVDTRRDQEGRKEFQLRGERQPCIDRNRRASGDAFILHSFDIDCSRDVMERERAENSRQGHLQAL